MAGFPRTVHMEYRGDDPAKAAEWKNFALKKRDQLLSIGGGAPLSKEIWPMDGVKISIRTVGVVDRVTIQCDAAFLHGLVTSSQLATAGSEQERFLLKSPSGYSVNKVLSKAPYVGGNIDWFNRDSKGNIKELLSWNGPCQRNWIAPWRFSAAAGEMMGMVFYPGFGSTVYRNGKVFAETPGKWVLGAALYQQFLVVAVGENILSGQSILGTTLNCHKFSIWYTPAKTIPKNGTGITWLNAGTFTMPHGDLFSPYAPVHIMAFSQSGAKFATLWGYFKDMAATGVYVTLIEGALAPDGVGGLVATCSTHLPAADGNLSRDVVEDYVLDESGSTVFHSYIGTQSGSETTLLSVDFQGETLVTLTRTNSLSATINNLDYGYTGGATTGSQTRTITNTFASSDGKISITSIEDWSSSTYGIQIPREDGGISDLYEVDSSTYTLTDAPHSVVFCDLRFGLLTFVSADWAGTRNYEYNAGVVISDTVSTTNALRLKLAGAGSHLFAQKLDVADVGYWPYTNINVNTAWPLFGNGTHHELHDALPAYPLIPFYANEKVLSINRARTGSVGGVLLSTHGFSYPDGFMGLFDIEGTYLSDGDPSVPWLAYMAQKHPGDTTGDHYLQPKFWV